MSNVTDKTNLKKKFSAGEYPTEKDFANWMDSYYHKSEDVIRTGAGWRTGDFLKELRSEGNSNVSKGGLITFQIPPGLTKLIKLSIIGKSTVTNANSSFEVIVTLQYVTDIKIESGKINTGSTANPRFPSNYYRQTIIKTGNNPNDTTLSYKSNSLPNTADTEEFQLTKELDFLLAFKEFQFFSLNIIILGGNIDPNSSFLYYGFEFE